MPLFYLLRTCFCLGWLFSSLVAFTTDVLEEDAPTRVILEAKFSSLLVRDVPPKEDKNIGH